MSTRNSLVFQELRLKRLEQREKENSGVCRKIRRNIRNIKKKSA